ncbi:hypothetical protein GHV40_01005 [Devosia sp. D6-9]|nr:hypothetical protein GHV40_01005 [Devosia sp. D6-9]
MRITRLFSVFAVAIAAALAVLAPSYAAAPSALTFDYVPSFVLDKADNALLLDGIAHVGLVAEIGPDNSQCFLAFGERAQLHDRYSAGAFASDTCPVRV